MNTALPPTELRHWATQCLDRANDPRVSGNERDQLLKMRKALLALAENEDWLRGNGPTPQVGSRHAASWRDSPQLMRTG